MTNKMNPEVKEIWLEALRDPEKYAQATGTFYQSFPANSTTGGERTSQHCCLAVLAHEATNREVPGIRWDDMTGAQIVCKWDAAMAEWLQPSSPEEAKQIMDTLPEIGADTDLSSTTHDGWQWRDSGSMTEGDLPHVVVGWAGLDDANPQIGQQHAIYRNDTLEESFAEIADAVEANL